METEIIKIAINKNILKKLESLAKSRNISMDLQLEQSFILLLGFYTLSKNERIAIMDSITKAMK